MTSRIFSLFDDRLGLLYLRDCKGKLHLETTMCLNSVGEYTQKCYGENTSGGDVRSSQFKGGS